MDERLTHRLCVRESYFDTVSEITMIAVREEALERDGVYGTLSKSCPESFTDYKTIRSIAHEDSPLDVIFVYRNAPGRANRVVAIVVKREVVSPHGPFDAMADAAWAVACFMYQNGFESISVPSGKMFGNDILWDDMANMLWMSTQWLPGCMMERITTPVSRKVFM